jgi:riboflavin synthase
VEKVENNRYQVTAVNETLKKTTMSRWKEGELINLERSLQWNGRIDGHIVQGHVDSIAICTNIQEVGGSWQFRFDYSPEFAPFVIEKGSISLDGISLTVFDVSESSFTVAVIPYTFHHTNMQMLQTGKAVNIEFDMIGKYVNRVLSVKANTK